GLVVGLSFYLAPVPEAPFVVLNLLSFSSLCLLAWYAARRLPRVPTVLIWAWLLTAPWTLDESTYVYNPSYVLTGANFFFIGALETYPATRRGLLTLPLANFMMGFGLFWVMQFHISYNPASLRGRFAGATAPRDQNRSYEGVAGLRCWRRRDRRIPLAD